MVEWKYFTLQPGEESIGKADGESLSHGSQSGESLSSRKEDSYWLEACP